MKINIQWSIVPFIQHFQSMLFIYFDLMASPYGVRWFLWPLCTCTRVHSCMQASIKKSQLLVNNTKGRVVNYHGPCAHVLEMACDYERKALKTSVMRNQDWRGIFPLKIFDVKRPPEWSAQPNVFSLVHSRERNWWRREWTGCGAGEQQFLLKSSNIVQLIAHIHTHWAEERQRLERRNRSFRVYTY